MNTEKVSPKRILYKQKEVLIVPVAHIGQQAFYDNLKDSIRHWKYQGYRIYYEQIKSRAEQMNITEAELDTIKKEYRYVEGSYRPTSESYEGKGGVYKGKMVQPDWEDLGVTDSDLNADVSLKEIVEEYERTHEKIVLTDCDYNTPLDSAYKCRYTEKGVSVFKRIPWSIKLDFRNQKVVELIKSGDDDKIVVIYGAFHLKGIKKLLKE